MWRGNVYKRQDDYEGTPGCLLFGVCDQTNIARALYILESLIVQFVTPRKKKEGNKKKRKKDGWIHRRRFKFHKMKTRLDPQKWRFTRSILMEAW